MKILAEDNFSSLSKETHELIFNMSYDILVKDFQATLEEKGFKSKKLEAINCLVEYFSDREEYEKCNQLRKLEKYISEN